MSNLNDPTAPDFEAIASGIAEETPLEENPNTQGLLSKDAFYLTFRACFNIGGRVLKLETLAITDDEKEAKEASDAIYDIALETPSLQFLLNPKSIWMQRTFSIGGFLVVKGYLVIQELKLKKEMMLIEQRNAEAAAQRAAMPTPAPHPAFTSGAQDPLSPNFGAGLNA